MLVGPSCSRLRTAIPWAASTARIILPSSAPSVSIFEATTTGGAATTGEAARVKRAAAQIAEIRNDRI